MIIDKSITLDLNRVQPLKAIRIHQGDVNSVNIVINVTNENKSVDLTGKAVMYDATISNILAEQDAHGSISGSKITIPITKNMSNLVYTYNNISIIFLIKTEYLSTLQYLPYIKIILTFYLN